MNPRRLRKSFRAGAALIVLALVWAAPAYGLELTVECSNPKAKIKTITQALNIVSLISKAGPHTIHVSGACNENVIIDGFDNLTLVANAGASINDPTPSIPDDNDVVDIFNSQRITVQGFTINGGFDGLVCALYSLCSLSNNTVQGASDVGIALGRGTRANLTGNTIQNNSAGGIFATNVAEGVVAGGTIQNNPGMGAYAFSASQLIFVNSGSGPVAIHDNGAEGVIAQGNSTVVLAFDGAAVTMNAADGVLLVDASVARIGGNVQITGNGGNGVQLLESSFAFVGGSADLSGNGGSPVVCTGTFSNARAVGGNAGLSCHNP